MSMTIGHWQFTLNFSVRFVDRPTRARTADRSAAAEGRLRRALRHSHAEADQARWWTDALLAGTRRWM